MYAIETCWGAPQCGMERIEFDTFWELLDYIEEHVSVSLDIEFGYARVIEL